MTAATEIPSRSTAWTAVFFSLLAVAAALFLYRVTTAADNLSFRYNYFFSAFLLTGAAFTYWSMNLPPRARRIFSPGGFLLISYLFYMIFGVINYYATNRYLFTFYDAGFEKGFFYLSAGLLALVLGMGAAVKLGPPEGESRAGRIIDHERLFYLALAFSFFVLGLNLYIYIKAGGIPIAVGFQKDDIFGGSEFGRLSRAVHLAVVSQFLWYFFLLGPGSGKKKAVALIVLVVNIGIVLGYGGRFYFFLPLLFFLFFLSRRMATHKNLLVTVSAAATVLVASSAIINLRGGERFLFSEVFTTVVSRLGVRGRDFYVVTDYFSDLEGFLSGFTLLPLVTNLVPAPFWTLLGFNKFMYTMSGGMFLQYIMGSSFWVNTGIIGELYLNGGLALIVGGLFVYGLVVQWIAAAWWRAGDNSLAAVVYGYVLANLGISLTAGHFYGLSFWVYEYGFLLLCLVFLVRRRTPDPPGVLP